MNRKKLFVSNNITIIKTRFQKFSKSNIHLAFFEIQNMFILWHYVFQFVTCKIRVDTFSLLYSKFLLAKLCLFVFGAIFAAYHL